MWFVDNIQRILRWVNAVLDSLGNIAMGAIGAAIGFIVGAMKLIIPVILDFFAKLLNISGIVDAVKNIINKIVGPIHKAIDKMVDWLKGVLNKVVDKVKGVFGKDDKKKDEAAQNDPEKQKKIDAGISDLRKEENKTEHNEKLTHEEAEQVAKTIKDRHPVFSKFYVVDGGDKWNYRYAASPEVEISGDKKAEGENADKPKELIGKNTPTLDKLIAHEKGAGHAIDKDFCSFRYVREFGDGTYTGTHYKGNLLLYVEHRAARKLGKVGEGPSMAKYKAKASYAASATKKYLEVFDNEELKGTPTLRIPDIYLENVVVGDIKDIQTISLDEQMRDNVEISNGHARYADSKKPIPKGKIKFDLVVRAGFADDGKTDATHVSAPLAEAINETNGKIYREI